MATVNGGVISVTLRGEDVNLSNLISQISAKMQQGASVANQYTFTIARLSNEAKKNESALAQQAQAMARAATASNNLDQAVHILSGALQQLTPNTSTAINVLNQLQQTLNKQAAQNAQQVQSFARTAAASGDYRTAIASLQNALGGLIPNTSAYNSVARQLEQTHRQQAAAVAASGQGLTNFATSLQQMVGVYFALTSSVDTFIKAINAGAELEKQQATFRALSGSAEEYEKNLAQAKEQQALFGGSLKDNLEDMSGFITIARNTGIQLKDLTNLARAMAVIDPAQGFKGMWSAPINI